MKKEKSWLIPQKYKKITKEYYEQLYANKLDDLEKMDNVLETYSPLKLNQEETDNLNRLLTRSETEYIEKKKKPSLQKKVQDQIASLRNTTKHTKNLYQPFSNSSKILYSREHFKRHSMKQPSPWYQNQTDTTKIEN